MIRKVDLFGVLIYINQFFGCFMFRMHLVIMFKEGKMVTFWEANTLVKPIEAPFTPLV